MKPIIFSGPMVRAILAGTKTQTRRVVKPQPVHGPRRNETYWPNHKEDGRTFANIDDDCPYGRVGDVLWVREKWKAYINCFGVHGIKYGDDECESFCGSSMVGSGRRSISAGNAIQQLLGLKPLKAGSIVPRRYIKVDNRWRSPIHMPRWASRVTLRLTAVRVERLHDITEADAKAEGVEPLTSDAAVAMAKAMGMAWKPIPYTSAFASTWESIHGPGSWAANPWVWVLSFERVTP